MKLLKFLNVLTSLLLLVAILFTLTHAETLDTKPIDRIPAVTTGEYIFIFLMSAWGATAALFQRFADGEVPRWQFVVARDLTNATLASFLIFLVCQHREISPPITAVASTLAAYGGARFMEVIYNKFVSAVQASDVNKGSE